jgi:hypothetical protein
MGVTFHQEEDDVRVLKIVGILRKPEFDAVSRAEARQWGPQAYRPSTCSACSISWGGKETVFPVR